MEKENNISFIELLDFEVFALPENNPEFLSKKNKLHATILIIYYNEKNDPELEVLLKNILSAAKLDFDKDIVLLKITPQTRFSFIELQKKMSVKDLLFFGIQPSGFGLNYSIEPYQPLSVKNLRILLLDGLEEVKTDVNKKKALWSCLKEMYL